MYQWCFGIVFFIAIRAEATLFALYPHGQRICLLPSDVRTVTAQITDLEKEEGNEELYGGGKRWIIGSDCYKKKQDFINNIKGNNNNNNHKNNNNSNQL